MIFRSINDALWTLTRCQLTSAIKNIHLWVLYMREIALVSDYQLLKR